MSVTTFLQRATDSVAFAGGGKRGPSRSAGKELTMTEPAAPVGEPSGREAGTERSARPDHLDRAGRQRVR